MSRSGRRSRRLRTSRQAQGDEQLRDEISRAHQDHDRSMANARVWLVLNREAIPVARCTVERLMRELGLAGARRAGSVS